MSRGDLAIRRNLMIPARELAESASRSSGPGGQHVNKTSTRVTLRWNIPESAALSPTQRARLMKQLAPRLTRSGTLVIHAGRSRSRAQNREAARERLAEIVRDGLRTSRLRVPTRPGAGARKRRLEDKKRRGVAKQRRLRPRHDDL